MMGGGVIRAVEVGNPTESSPSKPVVEMPKGANLVSSLSVEVRTGDLEEIERITFRLNRAELRLFDEAGGRIATATELEPNSSSWVLAESSLRSFVFKPGFDDLKRAMRVQLVLYFEDESPGRVQVNGAEFSIAPQASPVVVTIPYMPENLRSSEQADDLKVPLELTKGKLFLPAAESGPKMSADSEPAQEMPQFTLRTELQ